MKNKISRKKFFLLLLLWRCAAGGTLLYAGGTINTYTVTFNANGGLPAPPDTVAGHGSKISAPVPAPTKAGYTFDGWYTSAAGKSLWDFDEEILKNRTLYARWTPIDLVSLALMGDNGAKLVSRSYPGIDSTTRYEAPCNSALSSLTIACTLPDGATGSIEGNPVAGSALSDHCYSWVVDVSKPGRKIFTIALSSGKRYTVVVDKRYGLVDLVVEHLGNIRVVNNNPAINGGFEFASCEWFYRESGEAWRLVQAGEKLFYSAGPSITDRFGPEDSMRVVLRTVDGSTIASCPDADISGKSVASGSSTSLNKSAYPNPVRGGGKIYLKESVITDGQEHYYSTFRLFTSDGKLITGGSASALIEGLTMPNHPGAYYLILDGKAGKKSMQIVVGH